VILYQHAKAGTGDFSKGISLDSTMSFLRKKLPQDGKYRLRKGACNDFGPLLSRWEALKRVRNYLDGASVGTKVLIAPELETVTAWVVRTAEYEPLPESFKAGVASIDKIATDVYERFNEKYGIVNLGICADKPGEHSKCNAWDIGVSKPKTADEIHAAILDIANYLRNRMLADIEGEPGLPVNGIIVMEQIVSRSDPNWRTYYGTPHVSHVHVSGWPNLSPGWV